MLAGLYAAEHLFDGEFSWNNWFLRGNEEALLFFMTAGAGLGAGIAAGIAVQGASLACGKVLAGVAGAIAGANVSAGGRYIITKCHGNEVSTFELVAAGICGALTGAGAGLQGFKVRMQSLVVKHL